MKDLEGLDHLRSDYERALFLQQTLIGFATQDAGGGTPQEYAKLRSYFLQSPSTERLLPSWVRVCRTSGEFWSFIKPKFPTYAERRNFIRTELRPLLDYCEFARSAPATEAMATALREFDQAEIYSAWRIALERKATDPEGAITLSRSLLESVCKHILDDLGISYDSDKIDLPELYKKTAKALKLSPSQHTEEIFRRILGGCSAIVGGLGQLRNKLGDAHGKGRKPVKPASRHAELAVNLSGALALFLIETHNIKPS